MIPKILLGSPISNKKAYILPEWLRYVRSLTYPELDILLVDNSDDPEWHKSIKGFKVLHVKPIGRPETYIAQSQEVIRQCAVANNFEYLFSLECDNFASPDIIQLLRARRLDNINVPYLLKFGNETTIGVQLAMLNHGQYSK